MQSTAFTQGGYYLVTGLWPVLHLRSFEAITGTKRDGWLAQTTGGLIAAIGLALITGARERPPSPGQRVLGVASALALGISDVVFAGTRRISRIYLLDALAETIVLAAWLRKDG
jgi:hypothetical protein